MVSAGTGRYYDERVRALGPQSPISTVAGTAVPAGVARLNTTGSRHTCGPSAARRTRTV